MNKTAKRNKGQFIIQEWIEGPASAEGSVGSRWMDVKTDREILNTGDALKYIRGSATHDCEFRVIVVKTCVTVKVATKTAVTIVPSKADNG